MPIWKYAGASHEIEISDGFDLADDLSNVLTLQLSETADIEDSLGSFLELNLVDGFLAWEAVKSGWHFTNNESLVAADAVQAWLNLVIWEYLDAKDALFDNIDCTHTVSDGFIALDAVALARIINEAIEESLVMTDAVTPALTLLVLDYLLTRDEVLSSGKFSREVAETMAAADTAIASWIETIAETAEAVDSLEVMLLLQILERMNLIDAAENTASFQNTIDETAAISDTINYAILERILESLDAEDSVGIALVLRAMETLNLSDILAAQAHFMQNVDETAAISDATSYAILERVLEALDAADTLNVALTLRATETLALAEAIATQCKFGREVTETAAILDIATIGWIEAIVESLTAEDAASLSLALQLNEIAVAVDLVTNSLAATHSLADGFDVVDVAGFLYGLSVEEAAVIADTITNTYKVNAAISESLVAADAVTPTSWVLLTISDALVVIDTISASGHFTHTISDGFNLGVILEIDDEIYECYALNTPKFLPSVYSGFNFNSYCVFNDRAFAANSDGVFEITGATDVNSEIHTGVLTHETDFGAANRKRFRKAYIGVSGDDVVLTMEQEDGERQAYVVDSKGKASLSRDVHGKRWSLQAVDFEELESIKLVPIVLARGK